MADYVEYGTCGVCGRKTLRWVHEYQGGGRRASMPFRSYDRWRHQSDQTLACDEEPAEFAGGTF